MPVDYSEPYSAGWWLKRLGDRLLAKTPRIDRLDRYQHGAPDAPSGAAQMSADFLRFLQKASLNLAALIVDAPANRLEPVGFRTGATGDKPSDDEAWNIWQANQLDSGSRKFHRTVLGLSEGYAIVGAVDPDIGAPLISLEDPRQVISEQDPGRRWRTLAALKLYTDEARKVDIAVVYLPGQVWRAFKPSVTVTGQATMFSAGGWEWFAAERVPLTRVPVVRYTNRSSIAGDPVGEFEDVIPHIDRINHMLFQRLVVATLQAFKQRAIIGLPDTDPITGEFIDYSERFTTGPDAMYQLPPGVSMWESSSTDLTGLLMGAKDDIKDLAFVTHTPLYMFSSDATGGSAEGASLSREGLTFKTKDRQGELGESHEQVMSLAFEVLGDMVRARRPDMEILWAPTEALSLTEQYQAASMAQAAGETWRSVMTDVLHKSPQQIERMERERAAGAPTGSEDEADVKAKADAMGVLIRAGVKPEDAAKAVGLGGVGFTGAVPTSLRLPEGEAAQLETV